MLYPSNLDTDAINRIGIQSLLIEHDRFGKPVSTWIKL